MNTNKNINKNVNKKVNLNTMSNTIDEPTFVYTNKYSGSGFITLSKYNKDGTNLYIGDKDSKNITKIDSLTMKSQMSFIGHNGIIINFIMTKNDENLISCSGDLSIIFWNSDGTVRKKIDEKGKPKFILENNNNEIIVYCEAFSSKYKSYFVKYNLETTELISKVELETKFFKENETVVYTAIEIINNDIVACDNVGCVDVRNSDNFDINKQFKLHNDTIKSIVLNKNKTKILTASSDGTCVIMDLNYVILQTLVTNCPINYAIFYAKDKKIILGGGVEARLVAMAKVNDINTKIYNIDSGKLVKQFTSHFGPIRHIDVFNKNFVTSGQDGIVKVHSFEKVEGINFDTLLIEDMIKPKKDKTNETNKIEKKPIVGMPKVGQNKTFFENTNNNDFHIESTKILKTLKLSNLPETIYDYNLYELFEIYGKVEGRINIIVNEKRSEHNNFYYNEYHTYINYANELTAQKAFDTLTDEKGQSKYIIDNHVIDIKLIEGKY